MTEESKAMKKNVGKHVPVITIKHLKELPKEPMVEYNWADGLTPEQAMAQFIKETEKEPTSMYCMIRWFIPIPKEKKEKKDDKKE